MTLAIGHFVTYPTAPGIGRVGERRDDAIRVDFFESAAEPIAKSVWKAPTEVRRARLGEQSRVFFQDGSGRWRAGRVVGGGPDVYFVRVPNGAFDLDLNEDRLRIRWEKPPKDPVQVLLSGANETPRYRDAREPVRRLLLAERAASGSATGIVSSGVRLHAHQINAALRVIRDPVQRYLLADEVGMGKTIQAGMILRQLLIDRPGRTVGVLVPDALIAQWESELQDKFFLDDFPTSDGESPVRVLGHSEHERWGAVEGADVLVVDEAHLLVRTADSTSTPYAELARLAHSAPRLLMLSATPFTEGPDTQLALLHLLDPHLFRWERRDEFHNLLEARHALAMAVFGLDEEPDLDNPGLLELQFNEIAEQLPDDPLLTDAIDRAMATYGPPGTRREPTPGDVTTSSPASRSGAGRTPWTWSGSSPTFVQERGDDHAPCEEMERRHLGGTRAPGDGFSGVAEASNPSRAVRADVTRCRPGGLSDASWHSCHPRVARRRGGVAAHGWTRDHRRPRSCHLTAEVGRYPETPATWRALAMNGESGQRVSVAGGDLVVKVAVAHRVPMRRDTMRDLERSVERVRRSLDDQAVTAGGGYADLVDYFTASGLPVPPLPAPLRGDLRRVVGARWSSLVEGEQPSELDDYLFQTDWLNGMVPDHVTLSQGGHGIRSYALTLRMAWGPVAIAVQEFWGGFDPSEDEAACVAQMFFAVRRVIKELGTPAPAADPSPRFRPIVVTYSGLRDGLRCLQWDDRLRCMVEMDLSDEDPWGHIASLARAAAQ